jgi:hypothetical protein
MHSPNTFHRRIGRTAADVRAHAPNMHPLNTLGETMVQRLPGFGLLFLPRSLSQHRARISVHPLQWTAPL